MTAAIDYEAFRAEVRDFALTNCPPDLREAVVKLKKQGRHEMLTWQRILYAQGWGAPGWPREHGGTGWDLRQRHIFDETLAECDCPTQPYQALRHIAPVLIAFGSDDQKARFLPPMLRGEAHWCQGYSEPGAGSDLASLKTAAVLDGDHYVVTGQKIWTTGAHEADMMYALVRTSREAKKQQGITMLLIPMDSPGLTVREIRTIDGIHNVNEVFFDNVRVPVANRVGEEGKAWDYGKFLLSHERLGGAKVAPLIRLLARTRRMVAEEYATRPDHPRKAELDRRLLEAEAEMQGVQALGRRAIEDMVAKRPLGALSSVIKLVSSTLMQTLDEIGLDATGHRLAARFRAVGEGGANAAEDGIWWLRNFMHGRARTIYGGSSEVQKNVLSRTLFGAEFAATPMQPGDLHDTAHRLAARFAARCGRLADVAARQGQQAETWDEIQGLGWAALAIPERAGGAGGRFGDVAALVEGAARGALALPVAACCGVAPLLLADAPALLDRIIAGSARVAPAFAAWHGAAAGGGFACRWEAGAPVLSGSLLGVEAPPGATHLALACDIAGEAAILGIAIDDPRLTRRWHERLDNRPSLDLGFGGGTALPGTVLLRGPAAAAATRRAQQAARLLGCVEAVAAMGAALEQTIAYLSTRVQFDAPLATQQVLRHRVADLFVAQEVMRAEVAALLDAVAAGAWPERGIALAWLHIAPAARRFAAAVIQLHGGMGMTEELPATRLNKRLLMLAFEAGDAAAGPADG
jgi:alkylation response protein AidB-like acyl-CoA dehydrogenase